MALVSCPNCGGSISDKAKKCIHCNYQLLEAPSLKCIECGENLIEGATICAKCGCPVDTEGMSPQKVEVTSFKLKPKLTKKTLVIAAAIFASILILIVGTIVFQKLNTRNTSAEYSENLENIIYTILDGAVESESCGNLINSVWYNSIYQVSDTTTDKYTRSNYGKGSYYDDFNDALSNLFSDSVFMSRVSNIKDNQKAVSNLMRKMINPPAEWEEAYVDLKMFYDAYVELTNLAISPTGSLSSYSSAFNEADSNLANYYSKMLLYIE